VTIFNTVVEFLPSIHYIYVETFLVFKILIPDEALKMYASYCWLINDLIIRYHLLKLGGFV
jgi:hypothetical protein